MSPMIGPVIGPDIVPDIEPTIVPDIGPDISLRKKDAQKKTFAQLLHLNISINTKILKTD
ncbi:hypothetical protein GBF26_11750 [Staphylococcus aureus]|uniref:Uncharacterized protein n=1 Tax=Staphylococcus aureus TaxID=1280 RepID=A0A6A9GY09_STAAU|nr:hypothetical protein SA40TW_02005 [Staphylococcus aureus]EWY20058.1 hypothetical protein V400_02059 [Staphylococcus aureus W73738]EYK01632.1 hypothetical protein V607_02141 [Staphylococcus aureus M17033]EYL87675.1 hypothetical protein V696_02144 [Staphylococcus aureus M64056]EYM19242.1 hypothetical protein V711_01165 [Staphylococcus aureus T63897]EYM19594.1 hypothetical protein V712_02085 [Staphylococcus aureus T63898]KAG90473.1 hypothetical protein W793_01927 [Staphylococcus aureus VET151